MKNVPCILCGSGASVVAYMPKGCVCLPNARYAPLCPQHWTSLGDIAGAEVIGEAPRMQGIGGDTCAPDQALQNALEAVIRECGRIPLAAKTLHPRDGIEKTTIAGMCHSADLIVAEMQPFLKEKPHD